MELLASSQTTHIGASANLVGLVCFVMCPWSHVKMLHHRKVSRCRTCVSMVAYVKTLGTAIAASALKAMKAAIANVKLMNASATLVKMVPLAKT